MPQLQSMQTIYQKLAPLGLSKKYVRESGLPSWWDHKLDRNPAALLEGVGHIAERLHLDLASLLSEHQAVRFKPIPQPKFKYRKQQEAAIPEIVPQIASRIAELTTQSLQVPFVPFSQDCNQIRQSIVKKSEQVTLASLLEYCWEHGVAVVYFNRYPRKVRKLAGMVQWQMNRPVIILSNGDKHPAWLAFTLAHELGHLALEHIKTGILVDTHESDSESNDVEEAEANRFAAQLLVNRLDNCFRGRRFRNNSQLRTAVVKKIRTADSSVDASALMFNYAWHSKQFAMARKAVNELGDPTAGDTVINSFFANHIDWDCLSDDHADHLEFVLGD